MLRFAEQTGTFGAGLLLGNQAAFPFFGGVIAGEGALQAQDAAVDGAGFRGVNATGTPPDIDAQEALVEGAGQVGRVGVGVAVAQAAAAEGTGLRHLVGTGAVAAQAASTEGFGHVGDFIEGQGGPQGQPAAVAGTGERAMIGSPAIAAQPAQAAGEGTVDPFTLLGVGAAAAQAAQLEGAGSLTRASFGVLKAQPATIDAVAFSGGAVECFLRTKDISVELPTVVWEVKLFFGLPERPPNYVHTDFKSLVIFQQGKPEPFHVAYRFSNDRKFIEHDKPDD